jgi:hypothetical protein
MPIAPNPANEQICLSASGRFRSTNPENAIDLTEQRSLCRSAHRGKIDIAESLQDIAVKGQQTKDVFA